MQESCNQCNSVLTLNWRGSATCAPHMSCVRWYKTGQWHKDSVAVANRGISKDFWWCLFSNIPPRSALSTSCVWFWSPCRSWCPDTRHTASAPETASRPASFRNGRGWWHHQVGRQHTWRHTPTQTHTISGMCNFCYSLFAQLSHQDRLQTSGGSVRCQAAAPSAEEEEQTTTTTTKRRVPARASRCPARCRCVQRCSLVLALFHYTVNRDVVTEQSSMLKVHGTLKQKVITWFNLTVRFLQTH